jgi:hypothetical protein
MTKQKVITKTTAMPKIAIVTYNRIGEGQYENGLMQREDKQIYIAQNGHRSKWAAGNDSSPEDGEARRRRESVVGYVIKSIDLKDMDQIYLYVGNNGGEEAIRQTAEIPAEKITYVMCDCNWCQKIGMISKYGNKAAKVQSCECGGRSTLERILKKLL